MEMEEDTIFSDNMVNNWNDVIDNILEEGGGSCPEVKFIHEIEGGVDN